MGTDRSLAVATVASAVLLSLRATLSLASGSWRQHRAALEVGSWRKLLALLMDALIWTALPVFVACVVHVDQGSSIRVCSARARIRRSWRSEISCSVSSSGKRPVSSLVSP